VNPHLESELDSALSNSANLHATNIKKTYLKLFVRVAKVQPEELEPLVEILTGAMEVNRSNVLDALYIFIHIAGSSDVARDFIKAQVPDDLIEHYEGDEDERIRGNAQILRKVINGAALEQFTFTPPQQKNPIPQNATIYNLTNSNLSINSPASQQSISIRYEELSEDIRNKLDELDEAIKTKDKSSVVKVVGYLADKAFDILVAVLAGISLKANSILFVIS
jgi:hypothetical protein